MITRDKIIAVCLVALSVLMGVSPILHAEPPPQQEIDEIAADMRECLKAYADFEELTKDLEIMLKLYRTAKTPWERDDRARRYRELEIAREAAWDRTMDYGQRATDLANLYYGTNVTGVRFVPELRSLGLARPYICDETQSYWAIVLMVGPGAFRFGYRFSPGWLAATKIHEGVHREQYSGTPDYTPLLYGHDRDICGLVRNQAEIEAYQAELAAAPRLGLTGAEKKNIEDRIRSHQSELTLSSTAGGNVTVPREGIILHPIGQVVNLVATPDTGYRFVNWTGDVDTIGDEDAEDTSITLEGNRVRRQTMSGRWVYVCEGKDYSITANFEREQYGLNLDSTPGGTVTTPGEGTFTYDAGTVVELMATPEDYGHYRYRFVTWTGDVDTIDDVNAARTTITMNGDYSITANFEREQYGLNLDSTPGGTVTTPGEGTFTYEAGTVVELVATPEDYGHYRYRFVNWTGDVDTVADVNAASTTITMGDHYSITANFEREQYGLNLDSTPGGRVATPGEGTYTYDYGTIVNLVAEADYGYAFDEWTGDVDAIDDVNAASTTITMNADYSITANFVVETVVPQVERVGSYRIHQDRVDLDSASVSATGLHYTVGTYAGILTYRTTLDWETDSPPIITEPTPGFNADPGIYLTVDWHFAENPMPLCNWVTITTEFVQPYASVPPHADLFAYKDVRFSYPDSYEPLVPLPSVRWGLYTPELDDTIVTDASGGYILASFDLFADQFGWYLIGRYRLLQQYQDFQDPRFHRFYVEALPGQEVYLGDLWFGHSHDYLDPDALWAFEDWYIWVSGHHRIDEHPFELDIYWW